MHPESPQKTWVFFFLNIYCHSRTCYNYVIVLFSCYLPRKLAFIKDIHRCWLSERIKPHICNNECDNFTVVLKLETGILSEARVLMGRSVRPTTLFLGSCCGISRGKGGEVSGILVSYVGADPFWGVSKL